MDKFPKSFLLHRLEFRTKKGSHSSTIHFLPFLNHSHIPPESPLVNDLALPVGWRDSFPLHWNLLLWKANNSDNAFIRIEAALFFQCKNATENRRRCRIEGGKIRWMGEIEYDIQTVRAVTGSGSKVFNANKIN
ncbi:hypothetical protein TNCV_2605061 [Trichonephila clavipes]|nr:hypothetical protein TNCV_2605061 [Trichonephila clavipes]